MYRKTLILTTMLPVFAIKKAQHGIFLPGFSLSNFVNILESIFKIEPEEECVVPADFLVVVIRYEIFSEQMSK